MIFFQSWYVEFGGFINKIVCNFIFLKSSIKFLKSSPWVTSPILHNSALGCGIPEDEKTFSEEWAQDYLFAFPPSIRSIKKAHSSFFGKFVIVSA